MQKQQGLLYVEDVMKILGYEDKKTAYKIIKKLNNELVAKGFLVKEGAVSELYLRKRFCLEVGK